MRKKLPRLRNIFDEFDINEIKIVNLVIQFKIKITENMKEFKYSFFARFIYRYANLFITALLLISALIALGGTFKNWLYVFPLAVHVLLIYVINRFYINVYKHFPFIIQADNEKMICKDFMNRRKVFEIKHSEIEKIEGGIFTGNPMRPVYITTNSGVKIGINQHMKGYNKLLTIILSNIPKELYQQLLKKIQDLEPPAKIKKARSKRAVKKK